ncbi:multidrug resistance efflux pump [Saccharopolyspora phatthalungensis]|uniref:Multidrug resistance efflux pump n=1 Tax=Saccharopolyspora phatthalungensis TaxID=664693 RepID=A0A840QIE8_9PSEU|nr:multidrug resistance efflux pump [Saccharopolyspora phatthalungensis]
MVTTDLPGGTGSPLQQLESEMADAREYVLRCRASGDEQAAQLHVVWIDLLLDEWNRRQSLAQQSLPGQTRVEMT